MTDSHRKPDGRFFNPWPDSEPRNFGDVVRWNRERRGQPRSPTPPRGSFPTAKPDIARPRGRANGPTATWIGHSTVLLQLDGLNVLTDPMFSQRASPVQWAGPRRVMDPALAIHELPPIDVVLLSHSHYDHLDRISVEQLARAHKDAAWIVPLELGKTIQRWGARQVVELDWWQDAEVEGMRVTATPARHFSARTPFDRNETLWCGYALEHRGWRAYFAGDTAYHPLFGDIGDRCGPFDFVMMPVGAYDPRWFMHVVHMDPDEAVRAYQDIIKTSRSSALPVMLGIHWGTFRLTDEAMDEPPTRTRERWRAAGLDDERLWIARFGETRRF